jgi:hypothetical protein
MTTTCHYCGAESGPPPADQRPYGPGGASICYPCGQAHKADTEDMMRLNLEMALAAGSGVAVLTDDGPQPFDGKL